MARFTLQSSFTQYIKDLRGIKFSCESGYISRGMIFIKESYSWDGCTGVPDTDNTYTASLLHDFLCEYRAVNRKLADKIFYKQLRYDGFKFAKVYYLGVRLFGSLWYNNIIK
jgi:hypothetical protein